MPFGVKPPDARVTVVGDAATVAGNGANRRLVAPYAMAGKDVTVRTEAGGYEGATRVIDMSRTPAPTPPVVELAPKKVWLVVYFPA